MTVYSSVLLSQLTSKEAPFGKAVQKYVLNTKYIFANATGLSPLFSGIDLWYSSQYHKVLREDRTRWRQRWIVNQLV